MQDKFLFVFDSLFNLAKIIEMFKINVRTYKLKTTFELIKNAFVKQNNIILKRFRLSYMLV